MKKYCSFILLLVLMVIYYPKTYAQNDSLKFITADLNAVGIDKLAATLERQTNLHFYYDAAQFDSLTFSINVKNEPLVKVLEKVFAKTDFEFSIAGLDYVFITRGKRINTTIQDASIAVEPAGGNRDANKKRTIKEPFVEKNNLKVGLENSVFEIGDKLVPSLQNEVILNGFITDGKTGENVVAANVAVEKSTIHVITDKYGYFSLST